jgi:predicted membrane protein
VTYIPVEILGNISAPWFASVLATLIYLWWVMALLGSAPAQRCSCCGTLLVGKVYNLCKV